MRRTAAALCLFGTLAGCQTSGQPAPTAILDAVPRNYRQVIADDIRNTFADPYSIRDASISQPIPRPDLIFGNPHTVCVRMNAKNRMGGYTGMRATMFTFKDGRLSGNDPDMSSVCTNASYAAFPEIDSAAVPRR